MLTSNSIGKRNVNSWRIARRKIMAVVGAVAATRSDPRRASLTREEELARWRERAMKELPATYYSRNIRAQFQELWAEVGTYVDRSNRVRR